MCDDDSGDEDETFDVVVPDRDPEDFGLLLAGVGEIAKKAMRRDAEQTALRLSRLQKTLLVENREIARAMLLGDQAIVMMVGMDEEIRDTLDVRQVDGEFVDVAGHEDIEVE